METGTETDWKDHPTPDAYEMVNDFGSALVVAGESRGKDRQRIANLLDCTFIEVRSLTTCYFIWDAHEAEREWRENRCECNVDVLHRHKDDMSDCTTTKPAESVWDFWNEDGCCCPWVPVAKDHPNAVKFRRGEI